MKILYLDPILGISGDMTISALLDAGLPFSEIEGLLARVPLSMPAIKPRKMRQGVIEGTHLDIEESHVHLSPAEMAAIFENLPVDEPVKADALAMLDIIVTAEATVHGVPKESTHLHELSHIDTLIDILSVAQGIHSLGIEQVYAGPVPHGRGTIKTAHGIVPNPAPATVEILKGYHAVFLDLPIELTTPTGATIVRHFAKGHRRCPAMRVLATGYGLGTYETDRPDALRVFIGETDSSLFHEEVFVIEADLDDMEPEYFAAAMERMRSAGALDVLCLPVFMKKGRPGMRLSLTVPEDKLDDLTRLVFKETTTFGMRIRKEGRRILRRTERSMDTEWGPVRVKEGFDEQGTLFTRHFEFEDVRKIADEKGLPYRQVLEVLRSTSGR